jgi:hypothetical protein
MRNHHKEDILVWGTNFRNISIGGSSPNDSSVRGSIPYGKLPFSIDVKGGEIY